jgi:hypothetical protein
MGRVGDYGLNFGLLCVEVKTKSDLRKKRVTGSLQVPRRPALSAVRQLSSMVSSHDWFVSIFALDGTDLIWPFSNLSTTRTCQFSRTVTSQFCQSPSFFYSFSHFPFPSHSRFFSCFLCILLVLYLNLNSSSTSRWFSLQLILRLIYVLCFFSSFLTFFNHVYIFPVLLHV